MQESRAELLQAFQDHPWLNMLHLHVGSQGLKLDTVIAGQVGGCQWDHRGCWLRLQAGWGLRALAGIGQGVSN